MGKLDPDRVRFNGLLEPFAPGLREELARLGYALTSATTLLQLAAHLSRWLDASGEGPCDLTGPVIDRFVVERRRTYANYRSDQALAPILGYLRELQNRIQTARKEMSLDFVDRIHVRLAGSDRATRIAAAHVDTIKSECLALRLEVGAPSDESVPTREIDVEGDKVQLWITKA